MHHGWVDGRKHRGVGGQSTRDIDLQKNTGAWRPLNGPPTDVKTCVFASFLKNTLGGGRSDSSEQCGTNPIGEKYGGQGKRPAAVTSPPDASQQRLLA